MNLDPDSTETLTSESHLDENQAESPQDAIPVQPDLFVADYYLAQVGEVDGFEGDAWDHFCLHGFQANRNPHPLFETKYYREKYLVNQPDVNPLLHYTEHSTEKTDTHPLLNMQYYVGQLGPEVSIKKPNDQTWLEYFLENNLHDLKSASIEFSSQRYIDNYPDILQEGENPLCHYVTKGIRQGRVKLKDWNASHPLFDERYYLDTNPDLKNLNCGAWQHFCEHGFKEDRNPHPIFHLAFYREKYLGQTPDVNPLLHFEKNIDQRLDPHPLFDTSFYLSQVSMTADEMAAQGVTPLEHFLKHNRDNLASPSPLFSSLRYLEHHQDLAGCQVNPLYHFLVYGQERRRRSFVDLENLNLLRFKSEFEIELMSKFQVPHQDFITSMANASLDQTIICVSHDASLTGAPLIILKIAEKLHDKFGVNVVTILGNGGDLQSRFESLGPTINLNGSAPNYWPTNFDADLELFKELIPRANVLGAFVSSAESRELLPHLKTLNVPIHSLIHEHAQCYFPDDFSKIAEFSDKVIVPSAFVQEAALANSQFEETDVEVLPQGLLNEDLLKIEPNTDSEVRHQWNIPANATLVLGCGTRDGRKGLDLFISTAVIALSKVPEGTLYFGWLGGETYSDKSEHAFWAVQDLETAGIEDYVKFMGQTDDVAPYFQACDMLYRPSRMDPFSCVVTEAMAAAKPVVLFDKGSGCVDLINDEGGAIVPFGNVSLAADAIIELSKYSALREQMGARNRKFVRENMNFDHYVDDLVDGLISSMGNPDFNLIKTDAYQSFFRRISANSDPNQEKVIFALPGWNLSGVNTFVENLIIELRKTGYNASILFTTRNSQKIETEHMPKVPYRYLTSMTLEPDQHRDRVAEYLKLNAPCVFVPNYDYISSSISSRLPDNVGILGVLHCDDDEHYLHGYQMGPYWNAMVAVSDTIKEKMLKLNPAFADRIHTIRYGIAAGSQLSPSRAQAERIRIIYTGRIIQQQKRIFDFVELTRQLNQRQIPFELSFVGDGEDEMELKSELASLIENGTVRFLGRCTQQEVTNELQNHDVLVLTSEYEGLPLSLLEAMAHGCVAVVTDIPSGISEILKHRENAMLSAIGAMAEMADNIEALHHDRELMGQLRIGGFNTLAERKLTLPEMAKQYAAILEKIFSDIDSKQIKTVPLNCPDVRSMLNVA